jgi:hypothetical protein
MRCVPKSGPCTATITDLPCFNRYLSEGDYQIFVRPHHTENPEAFSSLALYRVWVNPVAHGHLHFSICAICIFRRKKWTGKLNSRHILESRFFPTVADYRCFHSLLNMFDSGSCFLYKALSQATQRLDFLLMCSVYSTSVSVTNSPVHSTGILELYLHPEFLVCYCLDYNHNELITLSVLVIL